MSQASAVTVPGIYSAFSSVRCSCDYFPNTPILSLRVTLIFILLPYLSPPPHNPLAWGNSMAPVTQAQPIVLNLTP